MIHNWYCSGCSTGTPPTMDAAVEHVAMRHASQHPAVVEVLVENAYTVRFRARELEPTGWPA